ncbi:hypothetical protein [Flavobacterium sp. N2013]|nr:hypothetical protein [Flavobacterium sp. N2013]
MDECLGYLTKSCKIIEEPKQVGEYYQELFNYLHDFGVIALESELQEIERMVLKMQQDKKMYSEEEVIELNLRYLQELGKQQSENGHWINFKEWFEQI